MAEIRKSKNVNEGLSKEFIAVQKTKSKCGRKRNSTFIYQANKQPKVEKEALPLNVDENVSLTEDVAMDDNESCVNVNKLKEMNLEIYTSLLFSQSSMVPVDPEYNAFMLQDFDESRCILKDFYIILRRRLIKAGDNHKYVYCCSCDIARQHLILSLPTELCDDQNSVLEEGRCIHIHAGKSILDEFDEDRKTFQGQDTARSEGHIDHSYDQKTENVDIYGIDNNSTVACIRWQEEFSTEYHIIRVDYTGQNACLKCCSCRRDNCKHIKMMLNQDPKAGDIPSRITASLNVEQRWRSRYVPVSVSKNKIPFDCPPEEQKFNRQSFQHLTVQDYVHLIPSAEGQCKCGSPWGEHEEQDNVSVYTPNDILAAKVYFRPCSNQDCQETREYDGCDDQILNMGTYLVSHKVLRNYLKQFVTQGTTMSSFYKQWYWEQLESGNYNFGTEFQYQRFRYSWYSFLNLLDIDYHSAFICPECGENPNAVVMDGVCLGLRKSFMPWKDYLQKKTIGKVFDGSSHNTRNFINNKDTRNLVIQFIKEGLDHQGFLHLLQQIQLYQPSLNQMFKAFYDAEQFRCPTIFADFLLTLTSNYAVCGLIHFNSRIFEILEKFDKSTLSSEDYILVENEVPFLSNFFSKFDWNLPVFIQPILKELVSKAKAPFTGKIHNLTTCDSDCTCRGNGYMPHLQHHCHRGDYVLDGKKPKVDTICKKKNSSHPTLIPGLFTISCVHGICYGYEFMDDPESPNIPFTILRTRFRKAPRLIIYDNACNLQNYCLNRDPVFFKDSWFVVDRFHWCNHVGCHIGYNLDLYKQFSAINTQVAEQRNSTLNKLKSMLSYMNLTNFKNHVKLFIWFRSMLSLSYLDPELPVLNLKLFLELRKVYSILK